MSSVVFTWDAAKMDSELSTCSWDPSRKAIIEASDGGRVLEAGCGLARWVKYLSDRGVDVTGLEYEGRTLKAVRGRWPELQTVQGDAWASPFGDGTFTAVLSLGVVEHFKEGPRRPLEELYRLLRPGGRAVVTVPCYNALRRFKRLGFSNGGYAAYPFFGRFFEYRFTPGEFAEAVTNAGFEIESHEPIALMDGVYHDLNPFKLLVKWKDGRFAPGRIAIALNRLLSQRPYAHNHMQMIVARKGGVPG